LAFSLFTGGGRKRQWRTQWAQIGVPIGNSRNLGKLFTEQGGGSEMDDDLTKSQRFLRTFSLVRRRQDI
jgi:hypothetical protein